MATTATATLDVELTGAASGPLSTRPAPFAIGTAIGHKLVVTLTAGNNAVTLPTGTTFVVLCRPTGNANTVTLKGATSGDAGIAIGATGFCAFTVASVTTLNLNSAGAETLEVTAY